MTTSNFTTTILVDQTPKKYSMPSIMFADGGAKKLKATQTSSMMSGPIIIRMFIVAK